MVLLVFLCHGTRYHTPNQPETTHICEVTVAAGQESRQGLGVSTESQNGRPWCWLGRVLVWSLRSLSELTWLCRVHIPEVVSARSSFPTDGHLGAAFSSERPPAFLPRGSSVFTMRHRESLLLNPLSHFEPTITRDSPVLSKGCHLIKSGPPKENLLSLRSADWRS